MRLPLDTVYAVDMTVRDTVRRDTRFVIDEDHVLVAVGHDIVISRAHYFCRFLSE